MEKLFGEKVKIDCIWLANFVVGEGRLPPYAVESGEGERSHTLKLYAFTCMIDMSGFLLSTEN